MLEENVSHPPVRPSHDASTLASTGDHCTSSTEAECPTSGRWSTAQVPPSDGVHRWMLLRQSPEASTPGVVGDQLSA